MAAELTQHQIEKLGNTLIYFSKGVSELNKTKILKLLFLLEEASIKKYGHPFFGFDFQVWKHGPVLKDVYIDLSEDSLSLLKNYIKRADYNSSEFIAANTFSDDEFSDNDIELMDLIINFARNKTAADLVKYTHNEDSLWRKSAQKNNVLEQFENGTRNSTDIKIDFSLLFEDDHFLKEKYEHAVENLEFMKHLKK
jgi:uncharacterized phage-associated protein